MVGFQPFLTIFGSQILDPDSELDSNPNLDPHWPKMSDPNLDPRWKQFGSTTRKETQVCVIFYLSSCSRLVKTEADPLQHFDTNLVEEADPLALDRYFFPNHNRQVVDI